MSLQNSHSHCCHGPARKASCTAPASRRLHRELQSLSSQWALHASAGSVSCGVNIKVSLSGLGLLCILGGVPMGIISTCMLVLVTRLHLQLFLPAHLCTFFLPPPCRHEYVAALDVSGSCGHMCDTNSSLLPLSCLGMSFLFEFSGAHLLL